MIIPDSNALASQNGHTIESQICHYLGIPHDPNAIVDAELDGHPLEVKSCQEFITVTGSKTPHRRGRFILNQEQHEFLVENNGIYAFVVHVDGIVRKTRLLKASLIDGVRGKACGKTWTGVLA